VLPSAAINLDHVHFQHKTVIYFVQTFGNIYTIVPLPRLPFWFVSGDQMRAGHV
jgi:hypothetical protein